METAQGQLLDALEVAVEEAFEKESDKWLDDAENDGMQVELYASSGAVAIKYGVGVEGRNGTTRYHILKLDPLIPVRVRALSCDGEDLGGVMRCNSPACVPSPSP